MLRPRQCQDDIPIRLEDREAANASPGYRHRQEETTSWEHLNPECAAEVDETIVEIAQPDLCRRQSPIDADRDLQFDLKKATALPNRTGPDGVQRAHRGRGVSVQIENYRCSQCTRLINDRPTWPN